MTLGRTPQIITLTDRAGRGIRFQLQPGNAAESKALAPLLHDDPVKVKTPARIGDKA